MRNGKRGELFPQPWQGVMQGCWQRGGSSDNSKQWVTSCHWQLCFSLLRLKSHPLGGQVWSGRSPISPPPPNPQQKVRSVCNFCKSQFWQMCKVLCRSIFSVALILFNCAYPNGFEGFKVAMSTGLETSLRWKLQRHIRRINFHLPLSTSHCSSPPLHQWQLTIL